MMKKSAAMMLAWSTFVSVIAVTSTLFAQSNAAPGTGLTTAGVGTFGQLGDSTNTSLTKSHAVITPASLSGKIIQKLAMGYEHGCVTTNDANGNVFCWGRNADGQVGDGSTTTRTAPVQVSSGSGLLQANAAVAVTAGSDHACVLVPQTAGPRSGFNEVLCWGSSSVVGRGASPGSTTSPATLNPMPAAGATDIDSFAGSTCIILTSGLLNCWGVNTEGQLGDDSTTNAPSLVSVVSSGALNGKTPTDVEVGSLMACALTNEASNNLYCWGAYGTSSSIGNGTTGGSRVPVAINAGGAKFTSLDIGSEHACGITSANRLMCWGKNGDNHLGFGVGTSVVTVPTTMDVSTVMGSLTLAGVSVGNQSTCVWSTTGRLACLGLSKGQFGVDPATVTGSVSLGSGFYMVSNLTAITGGALSTNGVRSFSIGAGDTAAAVISALTAEETAANSPGTGAGQQTTTTVQVTTTSTTTPISSTTTSPPTSTTSPVTTTTSSTISPARFAITTARLSKVKGARRLSIVTTKKVRVYQISYGGKRPGVAPKRYGTSALRRVITIRTSGTVWVRVQSGSTWSAWVRAA